MLAAPFVHVAQHLRLYWVTSVTIDPERVKEHGKTFISDLVWVEARIVPSLDDKSDDVANNDAGDVACGIIEDETEMIF